MRRRFVAVAACCVAGVTACSPAVATGTSATATPTAYQCIEDGRLPAGACSKADFEQQQREQALFREAQQAFQDFEAERNRVSQLGGAEAATPALETVTTGPFRDQVVTFWQNQRRSGHQVKGEMIVRGFRIERSRTRPGSEFDMRLCEDGTATHGTDAVGHPLPPGELQLIYAYFKHEDNRLKVWDADGEWVDSCD